MAMMQRGKGANVLRYADSPNVAAGAALEEAEIFLGGIWRLKAAEIHCFNFNIPSSAHIWLQKDVSTYDVNYPGVGLKHGEACNLKPLQWTGDIILQGGWLVIGQVLYDQWMIAECAPAFCNHRLNLMLEKLEGGY